MEHIYLMKGGGVSFALPYLLDGSVEPDQE